MSTITRSPGPRSVLGPGGRAPDFTLRCTPDQSVSLNEFRGRPVVLAFYPADWSPVCGDQMALYNEMLGEFQEFQAELVSLRFRQTEQVALSASGRFRTEGSGRTYLRRLRRKRRRLRTRSIRDQYRRHYSLALCFADRRQSRSKRNPLRARRS